MRGGGPVINAILRVGLHTCQGVGCQRACFGVDVLGAGAKPNVVCAPLDTKPHHRSAGRVRLPLPPKIRPNQRVALPKVLFLAQVEAIVGGIHAAFEDALDEVQDARYRAEDE